MNNDTLEKGIKLRKKIYDTKKVIDIWKNCTEYKDNGSVEISRNSLQIYPIQFDLFLSFEEARKMAIDKLSKELEKLNKEFEEL